MYHQAWRTPLLDRLEGVNDVLTGSGVDAAVMDMIAAKAGKRRKQLTKSQRKRSAIVGGRWFCCAVIVANVLLYAAVSGAPMMQDEPAPAVRFLEAIPILRIFDETKAREFYCGFLGFEVAFEHRFGLNMPLYMEVARAGLRLHLSEHHGDATPGSTIFVPMSGVHALQRELAARDYRYARPGVERQPWGDVMQVHDPFGNRIRFCERIE